MEVSISVFSNDLLEIVKGKDWTEATDKGQQLVHKLYLSTLRKGQEGSIEGHSIHYNLKGLPELIGLFGTPTAQANNWLFANLTRVQLHLRRSDISKMLYITSAWSKANSTSLGQGERLSTWTQSEACDGFHPKYAYYSIALIGLNKTSQQTCRYPRTYSIRGHIGSQ